MEHDIPPASAAHAVRHPEIPEQDPTHDMNGRKVWSWLIGCAIGVFVTIWLLSHVFQAVTFRQRELQIEKVPAVKVEALRQQEAEALSAGEGRISIDEAIRKYVDGK